MWGGNGFWSPTENKPAMRAFADSLRDRSVLKRRRRTGWRFVAELVAVVVVAAGIYGAIALIT